MTPCVYCGWPFPDSRGRHGHGCTHCLGDLVVAPLAALRHMRGGAAYADLERDNARLRRSVERYRSLAMRLLPAADGPRLLAVLGETVGYPTAALEDGALTRLVDLCMGFVGAYRRSRGPCRHGCSCYGCLIEQALVRLRGDTPFPVTGYRPKGVTA